MAYRSLFYSLLARAVMMNSEVLLFSFKIYVSFNQIKFALFGRKNDKPTRGVSMSFWNFIVISNIDL